MKTTPPTPYTFRFLGKDIGLPWLNTLFVCDYRTAKGGLWHTHDQLELVCRLRGELRYDFADYPSLTVHQGQALVIPAGAEHRLSDEIDTPGLRICLLISKKATRCPPDAIVTPAVSRRILQLLNDRAFAPFPLPALLQPKLYQIVKLAGSPERLTDPLQRAHFQVLLTDALFMLAAEPVQTQQPMSQAIECAKAYMESRLGEKIRIRDLLDCIGYGQSQFFHLFRKHTSMTPNEWIARRRINLACELLCNTSDQVRTIAARVGWPDTAYFCRIFKQQVGQTPLAYRNSHSPQHG